MATMEPGVRRIFLVAVTSWRRAYFGPKSGRPETPVLRRRDLTQTPRQGPLIVEEYDATCVVPPSERAMLAARSYIIIEL